MKAAIIAVLNVTYVVMTEKEEWFRFSWTGWFQSWPSRYQFNSLPVQLSGLQEAGHDVGSSWLSFLCTSFHLKRGYTGIYYPTALPRVQITPKTSTNITQYLYSRGPVRQVFSQRASDELDWSYEKKICLSKRISFLRFFLTEILKWKTWIDG